MGPGISSVSSDKYSWKALGRAWQGRQACSRDGCRLRREPGEAVKEEVKPCLKSKCLN